MNLDNIRDSVRGSVWASTRDSVRSKHESR